MSADRAGDGGDILIRAGKYGFDGVFSGLKTGDDKRLVKLNAAACAQCEDLAAGIAGTGNADAEAAGCAALLAAGFQNDLMDDKRRPVRTMRMAHMRRAAETGLHPLGKRTAGRAAAEAIATVLMMIA